MLRALWPYFVVDFALATAAGLGYGVGKVSAAGFYGFVLLACLISAYGVTRWESRRPD
jgi:hypothetical protein